MKEKKIKGVSYHMPKSLDLTNQRFERLIALEKAPSKKGKTYWKC